MRIRKPKVKVLAPAQDLVAPWLAKLGITPGVVVVFEAWDRLLGAEAAKASAVGLKNAVLYVDVDSSARIHDLSLRKPRLLKRLKDYVGERRGLVGTKETVSDIIFSLARDR
jgi:predicted nucleic acid-binding Zn ribbon protein